MLRELMRIRWSPEQRVFLALGGAHIASILLFMARAADANNQRYWFLLWNALLAAIPLAIAWWLSGRLQALRWKTWLNGLLTLLWISFLPNSFYIISDLIHLHQTGEVSLLYDAVLFMSFILNGLLAGYISVYLIHRQLLRRMIYPFAHVLIGGVFLLCGMAIYLGRYMRWNSWDIFLHPAAVLFDVSTQFISPASQGLLGTTTSMFVVLASTYAVGWQLVRLLVYKK